MHKAFYLVLATTATIANAANPPTSRTCPTPAAEAQERTALAIKTKGTSAQRGGGGGGGGGAAVDASPEAEAERSALAIKTKGTGAQRQADVPRPSATDCDDTIAK